MLQSRIRRGELDREIKFIKKVIVDNAHNEDKETGWVYIPDDYTAWSRVRMYKGKDVVIADRLTNVQQVQFTIDHREDLTTQMRVVYKDKQYEIISISENEDGRDRYLDVMGSLLDSEEVLITVTADSDDITADSDEITADQT